MSGLHFSQHHLEISHRRSVRQIVRVIAHLLCIMSVCKGFYGAKAANLTFSEVMVK